MIKLKICHILNVKFSVHKTLSIIIRSWSNLLDRLPTNFIEDKMRYVTEQQ